MSGDEMIGWPEKAEDWPGKAGAEASVAALRARRNEPPLRNPRRRKMTKLRNIVGIALVAMSMLTGLAHAQEQYGREQVQCYDLPGYGEVCVPE